jgi:hypothetical protein
MERRQVPIVWVVPDGLRSRYASNLLIQQTDQDIQLLFFEVHPPLIVGEAPPPDPLPPAQAECVARIIVTENRLRDFIAVFESALGQRSAAQERDRG